MTESKTYIFNLETTKIELHFEKAEYDALSAEQKQTLKSAFLWSNYGKCWVSRAKEPNLWRTKEVAKKLGFTEEKREGERLTYAEQIDRQTERAEARAERYETYSDNAELRAEQLQKPINDMRGDIAFFTQPNINSSSGRAFTSRRNKMFELYEKGFEEYRKSDYFKEKAAVARVTASQEHFRDPAYLDRRIRECKTEIAKREKNIISYEEILYDIEKGAIKKRYDGEVITADEVRDWLNHELELVEVAMDKQGYLENCLDEIGGIRFNKDNIKVGYIVRMQKFGVAEIVSTGPLNITYKILHGGAAGGVLKGAYAEIIEVIKKEEKKHTDHPFKVGEQFKARIWDNGFHEVIYEIVKATSATIQLKPVGSDTKPITRKPKLVAGTKRWAFSINDSYSNTFYKEVETQ